MRQLWRGTKAAGLGLVCTLALAFLLSEGTDRETYRGFGASQFAANGFEYGRGAITVGCSFSYQAGDPEPYGIDNPDVGLVGIGIAGNRAGGIEMSGIVDGPIGMTALIGHTCRVSIDWSRFPIKGVE